MVKGVPIGHGHGQQRGLRCGGCVRYEPAVPAWHERGRHDILCGKGEKLTSGTAHYDNVSASILGGFVVVRVVDRPTAIAIEAPADCASAWQLQESSCRSARQSSRGRYFRRALRLNMMVSNVANASLIVSGFARGDIAMIGSGMNDRVVEDGTEEDDTGIRRRAKSRERGGRFGSVHQRGRTVDAGGGRRQVAATRGEFSRA